MGRVTDNTIKDGNRPHEAAPAVANLAAGTMVSRDIRRSRRFYEEFLGLECVQHEKDRLLIRDTHGRAAMNAARQDFFVIEVQQVDTIANPQRMLHHWGIDVSSIAEVERIHTEAARRKEELGINKVHPVSQLHGAHSFYFADRDMNWWEIEYRLDGLDNEGFFERGDMYPNPVAVSTPSSRAELPTASPAAGSVVSNAHLTHGTCEQRDLEKSRSFLENVLRLRCVRHLEPAQMFAGSGPFGVFAIRLPRVKPQTLDNRWVVEVDGIDEIHAVRDRALQIADTLRLEQIGPVYEGRYGPTCILQDLDGNWWEVISAGMPAFAEKFSRGDVQ
jgi:catechol 2,3-dioxygenase-like lactoylglutathione lyase family enzyme